MEFTTLMMIESKPVSLSIQEMRTEHNSTVICQNLKTAQENSQAKAKAALHLPIASHVKARPQVSALGRTIFAAKTLRPKLNNGTKPISAAKTLLESARARRRMTPFSSTLRTSRAQRPTESSNGSHQIISVIMQSICQRTSSGN